MTSPIPRSSLFNIAVAVHRAGSVTIDGNLNDWDDAHRLPDVAVEGRKPFASLWIAWSPEGLWFAAKVPRTRAPQVVPNRPATGDCLELYLDTRDIRTAHRAGRYCHKFIVAPVGGAGRGKRPIFLHEPIARSLADPPSVAADRVELASAVMNDAYALEVFFPANVLNGYDVEINRRLGLAYVVHDIERPMQVWPHESDLPVWVDPGLWAVIELVD